MNSIVTISIIAFAQKIIEKEQNLVTVIIVTFKKLTIDHIGANVIAIAIVMAVQHDGTAALTYPGGSGVY